MNPEFAPVDVFLFEPDDDCVSRIICKLDNSKVSHAALYYDKEKHLMAEANLSGVQVNPAPGEKPPRTVHVRRYTAAPFKADRIVSAARKYLDSKEKYAFDTMVLVGLLLISRRFIDNPTYLSFAEKILRCINFFIEKSRKKHPMICSQFVVKCYGEAGYPLTAPVRDAIRGPHATLASLALGRLERLDSLDRRPELNRTDSLQDGGGEGLLNSLCCGLLKLLEHLEESGIEAPRGADAAAKIMFPASDSLVREIAAFAGTVMRGEELSAGALSPARARNHINDLIDNFITPGDLLACAQLETVEVLPGVETNAG